MQRGWTGDCWGKAWKVRKLGHQVMLGDTVPSPRCATCSVTRLTLKTRRLLSDHPKYRMHHCISWLIKVSCKNHSLSPTPLYLSRYNLLMSSMFLSSFSPIGRGFDVIGIKQYSAADCDTNFNCRWSGPQLLHFFSSIRSSDSIYFHEWCGEK